jgi:hypothetical protein
MLAASLLVLLIAGASTLRAETRSESRQPAFDILGNPVCLSPDGPSRLRLAPDVSLYIAQSVQSNDCARCSVSSSN